MSLTAELAAIKAIVATATGYQALDLAEAQTATLPATYTEVYLSRRFGGNVRGDTSEVAHRRLQTRAVASSLHNARLIEDRLAAAFEHTSHDVAGSLVHFAFESSDSEFEYDKTTNRFHRLTDWTFAV